jgi:hypothetical protein
VRRAEQSRAEQSRAEIRAVLQRQHGDRALCTIRAGRRRWTVPNDGFGRPHCVARRHAVLHRARSV